MLNCRSSALFDATIENKFNSTNCKQWEELELTASNSHQLYLIIAYSYGNVPSEFDSIALFRYSDNYTPKTQAGIFRNGPLKRIYWTISGEPVSSKKDVQALLLQDFSNPFFYGVNS